MSEITPSAYILTEADGSDPRIILTVKTSAELVTVESRARGRLLVRDAHSEAQGAIAAARGYIRSNESHIDGLYVQMDRIRASTPGGTGGATP